MTTPTNDFDDDQIIDEDYDDEDEEESDDDISDDIDIDDEPEPSLTYKIDFGTGRVVGKCDAEDALAQSIRMTLATPRMKYLIYSFDYGSDISDYFGKDLKYAMSVIEHVIREALEDDDRIESLDNFSVETGDDNSLIVGFTVHSTVGSFQMESEVSI